MKKKALVALTRGGLTTARKIGAAMEADIYTLENGSRLTDLIGEIFPRYREIILVMSCGIAVRSIAPYLKSKLTDPAVVVLDEKGNHVISLISGHVGGANALAREVAKITGGTPVITTASDTLGILSVDMIAKTHNLAMADMEQVKKVTAAMVNGRQVAVIKEGWQGELDPALMSMTWDEVRHRPPEAVIYIGSKKLPDTAEQGIPIAHLIPRNLVIGTGCRRNTDPDHLFQTVTELFSKEGLALAGVMLVASVDVKQNEPAVVSLAERLAVPLKIISREEIARVENNFTCSDFVRKTIGVGCVAEPAASIASGGGRCLVPKTAKDGITLCVYEKVV